MNCLVTGGAGFIGSNLVDALIEEGHKVRILDNMVNGKMDNIKDVAEQVRFAPMDIRDDDLDDMFSGVDVVFHLAALARVQPSIDNPMEFDSVNVHGTLNMLEHARRNGVKRFVFSSSSSVYGEPPERVLRGQMGLREHDPLKPMSPYATQKMVGEEYCRLYCRIHDMDIIALRYFNVYGERQSIEGAYKLVMGIFAEQKLKGEPLTIVGDGKQRRDFTYVADVVEANICAASAEFKGFYAFNVGSGDNRSVNDIAKLFGGPTTKLPKRIEPRCTLADTSRVTQSLDWEPTMTVEEWVPKWKKELGIE